MVLTSQLFSLFIWNGYSFYFLILYSIKFPFCSCCATRSLHGSYKCLNHISYDVHMNGSEYCKDFFSDSWI